MKIEGLDKKSLRLLRKKLASKAPFIQTDGLRPSRCILGQPAYSIESRGYRNVMLYIQKGFGTYGKVCSDVIGQIVDFQYRMGIKYFLCLFSFGWKDAPLKHTGRGIFIRLWGNKKRIANDLCEIAGDEPSAGEPVITSFFPKADPYSHVGRVRQNDLLVFFCNDRTVSMNKETSTLYNRLRHRALWVFCDEDVCEWEFCFRPRVMENTEEIKQQEGSCQVNTEK